MDVLRGAAPSAGSRTQLPTDVCQDGLRLHPPRPTEEVTGPTPAIALKKKGLGKRGPGKMGAGKKSLSGGRRAQGASNPARELEHVITEVIAAQLPNH